MKNPFKILYIRLIGGVCGRCRRTLYYFKEKPDGFTIGYYDIQGYWGKLVNSDEKYLCDACMWKTPAYIAMYGGRPIE